jgi:DNA-binding NarL/FixJ family response regulator
VTRVVIADDHRIFREGLAELLAGAPGIVVAGTAGDGETALAVTRAERPDVLILDVTMPGLDGYAVAAALRDEGLPVRVLMLSMHKDAGHVRRALELGVAGYVLKDDAFEQLAEAVSQVAAGGRYVSATARVALAATEASGDEPLTAREREVVAHIAAGRTTREIAATLGISVKTVETHRQRIMDKLGCRKVTDIVLYAVRTGLAGQAGR